MSSPETPSHTSLAKTGLTFDRGILSIVQEYVKSFLDGGGIRTLPSESNQDTRKIDP